MGNILRDDSTSEGGSSDDNALVSSGIFRHTNVKKEGFDGTRFLSFLDSMRVEAGQCIEDLSTAFEVALTRR
jgi:hypothetical protein